MSPTHATPHPLPRETEGAQRRSEVLHFLMTAHWLNSRNRFYGADGGSPGCFDTASWGFHRVSAWCSPEHRGQSEERVRPDACSLGVRGPPPSVPRICPEFLLYVWHDAGVLGVSREADRWAPVPPTPSNGGDRP